MNILRDTEIDYEDEDEDINELIVNYKKKVEQRKENNVQRIERQFDNFLIDLMSAVNLVGGCGDDRWREMSLEKVYKNLKHNGSDISFIISKCF